jgi:hypothetical protein
MVLLIVVVVSNSNVVSVEPFARLQGQLLVHHPSQLSGGSLSSRLSDRSTCFPTVATTEFGWGKVFGQRCMVRFGWFWLCVRLIVRTGDSVTENPMQCTGR